MEPHFLCTVEGVETKQGWGIARHDGRLLFLPGGLPGDRVVARIRSLKKSWAKGEILEFVELSPKRRPPPCPHHPQATKSSVVRGCGGCPLMCLSEEHAREIKRDGADRALKIHGISLPLPPLEHLGPSLGYRWRLRARWSRGQFGLNQAHSSHLCPLTTCSVLSFGPHLQKLAPLFSLPGQGEVRITENPRGELLFHVRSKSHTTPPPGLFSHLVELGAIGLLWNTTRFGAPVIDLGTPAAPLLVSGRGFAQAGPWAQELLQKTLDSFLSARPPQGPLLECYAGAGTLTTIAKRYGAVTALESSPEAAHLFRRNHPEGVTFRTLPTEALTWNSAVALLLLDPPRTGISKAALQRLLAVGAPAVVLFSCDLMAGARDLKGFVEAGYEIADLRLLDTMPQTPHLEMATLLQRAR